MSDQHRTWFIDFDGTLVLHESYILDKDIILDDTKLFFDLNVKENDYVIITTARDQNHKERIERFLVNNNIKFDIVLCGLTAGPRILINDIKPDGIITAYSYNLERDKGILSVDWNKSCSKDCIIKSLKEEIKIQRKEIAALREERRIFLNSDNPPGYQTSFDEKF